MKKLLTLILGIAIVNHAFTQDYKYDLEGVSKVMIDSDNSITLLAHDHNHFLIKEIGNEDHKSPKSAEGLKTANGKDRDNTGFGVEIREDGNILYVTSLHGELADELIIYLPRSIDITISSLMRSTISIEGFESEVVARNHKGDIRMKNVTGPIVAQNEVGDIIIQFKELSQISPSSIVMENGEVDITFPKSTKVTIESKMRSGKLYSNFDLGDKSKGRSNTIKLNGGGIQLFLQSLAGDIRLREAQ